MGVTSSFSPETDLTWIKWKKNEATDLAKQRAVNWPRTFPSLSFWQTQLCPSQTSAALKFANSEYVIVSGESHFPFFIFMTFRFTFLFFGLHLFSHLEFYFLGKLQRKTKKSKVLKMIEYSPSGFLYFLLLFSPHHELGLEQEQWDSSCPVCQYKLKQLQLKNHPQAKKEGYFPRLSSVSLTALHSQRKTETEEQRSPVESTDWRSNWSSLGSVT